MATIEFKNVTKTFGKNVVIENLNLTIKDGTFTVLVGPSGCGKTTLLRMIAGIGPQSSGQVLIGGRDVTDVPPGERGVAMVFQNYAIYPTMSVRENIEFGLKNNKVDKQARTNLINEISTIVGLEDYLDRMPGTLSGGQRQRVALARAMVKKPKVFLMDEPLSNLDAKLRVQMRVELIELHKRLGSTFVYVTHDQVEAMSMADTIVLMNKGIIQQEDSPEVIYNNPNNLFTSQFIGTPPMNILPLGKDEIKFGFRPEKIVIEREKPALYYSTKGTIITREMLGSETIYQVRNSLGSIMVKSLESAFDVGEEVYIGVADKDLYFFGDNQQSIRRQDTAFEKCMAILGGVRG